MNEYLPFYDQKIPGSTEMKEIINFINSDDEQTKLPLQSGKKISYLPTNNIKLTVNKENCLKYGIVPPQLADRIVPVIEWKMKKTYLFKNDLMLFDFLATSDWTRPLYFANPGTVEDVFEIDKYCHLEGFVYKFMPVLCDNYIQGLGGITESALNYDLMMNKFKWGRLNQPGVYVDRESYRNSMIPKNNFLRLAQMLITENKKDSAIKVLDRCQEVFPHSKIAYDMYMLPFAEAYYQAGAPDKAAKLIEILSRVHMDNINYYTRVGPKFSKYYDKDKQQAIAVLRRLSQLTKENKQDQLTKKIETFFASNPQLLSQ